VREPFGSSAPSITDLTVQKKNSMKNLLRSGETFQHKKEKHWIKTSTHKTAQQQCQTVYVAAKNNRSPYQNVRHGLLSRFYDKPAQDI